MYSHYYIQNQEMKQTLLQFFENYLSSGAEKYHNLHGDIMVE